MRARHQQRYLLPRNGRCVQQYLERVIPVFLLLKEETLYIHVAGPDGGAKFLQEPEIHRVKNHGFSDSQWARNRVN